MKTTLVTGLVAAVLAAAGCGEDQGQTPPAQPPGSPQPAPPAVPATATWSFTSSGEGSALTLAEGDGPTQFRLACLRGDGEFHAEAAGLTPIASEERFTLGLSDEAFTLVADLQNGPSRGVRASGPRTPDLLDRLERGEVISVSYGAQHLGPLPTIPEDSRRGLVTDCRDTSAPSV